MQLVKTYRGGSHLKNFVQEHKDTVIKPLDGMGGASIFRIKDNDPNLSVILETITNHFSEKVMIQEYIPEILEGDKRILVINGKPMQAAIARIPAQGELRGNLAAGASAVAKSLSERDIWICAYSEQDSRAKDPCISARVRAAIVPKN